MTLELRAKRAALIASAREIIERADGESRGLSAEEDAQYSAIMADVDALRADIDRRERLATAEADLDRSTGTIAARSDGPGDAAESAATSPPEVRAAFRDYLRFGTIGPELRTVQATQDPLGGYLAPPEEFVRDLIRAVDDIVHIRRYATVHALPMAESLGAPALDADLTDSEWTTELAAAPTDTSLRIGKRNLTPVPLAKEVRISATLLRRAPNVEALVRERMAYRFALPQERGFLNGTGVNQPLGLFTASPQGISTARDVTAGTTTAPTFDGLLAVKYALKDQYHANARWLIHRNGIERIATLKDTTNQYLWRPDLRAGEPDRLLGFPVLSSEFVPATFTTGLYYALLGDLRHYWIVESLGIAIQRLVELYARTNEVGFIGRPEIDGMPVLEEAFVRARLA